MQKPIEKEDRILRYQEDERFCITLRAHFDYDRSDMWPSVTVQNLWNGEKKTYIFNANQLSRAQDCYLDHIRLLLKG